jgi:hypothetical protein
MEKAEFSSIASLYHKKRYDQAKFDKARVKLEHVSIAESLDEG